MRPPRSLLPGDPRRNRRAERDAFQRSAPRLDPVTGWLVADALATFSWSSLPATWAGWTTWNMAPRSPLAYEKFFDVGLKTLFVPLVAVSGDGTPTVEERHSDDNISYTPYTAVGPQVNARYIWIRVHMAGAYPKLKGMRVTLSGTPVEEIIQDLNTSGLAGAYRIGTGDIRLPITKTFSLIRKVDITLQSVGAGWSVELIDKDKTVGPRIKIYNASNVLADATIDATVTGL